MLIPQQSTNKINQEQVTCKGWLAPINLFIEYVPQTYGLGIILHKSCKFFIFLGVYIIIHIIMQ